MGFITRALVPRSVRRATHPVRTVKRAATPKTVKQIQHAAHPIDNAVYGVQRALNTKPRPRSTAARGGSPDPSNLNTAEWPLLGEDKLFMVFERERLKLIEEARKATAPVAQFEALAVSHWLYERQMETVTESLGRTDELDAGALERYETLTTAWSTSVKQNQLPLMKLQNALVAQLGRETCQRIADERARPRVDTICDTAMDGDHTLGGMTGSALSSYLTAEERETLENATDEEVAAAFAAYDAKPREPGH